MPYEDLSEHTGALVALLGLTSLGLVGLFWYMVSDLKKKVCEIYHYILESQDKFVNKDDCERVQNACGVKDLWTEFNHHEHAPDGRVVRG